MGSNLDFAPKLKQTAVYAATFALVAVFVTASGVPAVEYVGKHWPCAKAPDLSHSRDTEAAVGRDIEAIVNGDFDAAVRRDIEGHIEGGIEAARDLGDEINSCAKAVNKAVQMAEKVVAEHHLPKKAEAELVGLADHLPDPALEELPKWL